MCIRDRLELTFAVHWYSAASVSTSDMNTAMLVYCVRVFIIGGLVGMSVVPLGLVHTMLTVTGSSTVGDRFTVHVKLKEIPTKMVSLGGVIITLAGGGTVGNNKHAMAIMEEIQNTNLL